MEDNGFVIAKSDSLSIGLTSGSDNMYTVTTDKAKTNSLNIPEPVAYLRHENTRTNIPVFKKMNWFNRMIFKLLFNFDYIKI